MNQPLPYANDDFDGTFFTSVTKTLMSKTDTKQLTIVASSVSVIFLMVLGSCIWCYTKYLRKRRSKIIEDESLENSSERSDPFEGWKTESGEKSLGASKSRINGYERANQNKNKIYKNVITPDKHIEFVIPTIPMHAQPISTDRGVLPEIATCSKNLSMSQASIPTEFRPQLIQEENQIPRIAFSLFYESATQILYVRLLAGSNMPENLRHCVIVKLFPGKGKQKTRDIFSESPVYNQEFTFHIRKSTLPTRVLRFKAIVTENPKILLGCLNLALKSIPGFETEDADLDLQGTHIWKYLELPSDSAEGIRIRLSLKWDEDPPGLLTLKVIEATGLHLAGGNNDYTSSHVKVTLQEQGRNIKSRKTRLVRWGSVPLYEDIFVVAIPQCLLGQISFLIEVIARGRLGSKVILGKISIGSIPYGCPSSDGMEFWEDMCHQKNIEVTRWLQLV